MFDCLIENIFEIKSCHFDELIIGVGENEDRSMDAPKTPQLVFLLEWSNNFDANSLAKERNAWIGLVSSKQARGKFVLELDEPSQLLRRRYFATMNQVESTLRSDLF